MPNWKPRLLVSALVASGAVGAAFAQQAPAPDAKKDQAEKLDTVTVTANRREEPLQQVPVPVSVIDRQTIRDLGLNSLQTFINLVPNAILPDTTGVNINQDVTIRGVGKSNDVFGLEPGFGLFRDGNYYGGTVINFGSLVDVQRVEVLRGPQGGLYGRNAVGGAMDIIYEKPGRRKEVRVDTLIGERQTVNVDVIGNLPAGENAAVRLVGWRHDTDGGEVRNITRGENMDASTDTGGRASVRWNLNDRLRFDWVAETSKADTFGALYHWVAPQTRRNLAGAVVYTWSEDENTVQRNTPNRLDNKFDYFAQDVNWDVDGLGRFTLALTYRKYKLDGTEDSDGGTPGPIDPAVTLQTATTALTRQTESTNKFAEIRWVSPGERALNWVAGASYYNEDYTIVQLATQRIGVAPGNVLEGYVKPRDFQQDTDSSSIFGEATYRFSPQFTASAGLRYTRDKKDAVTSRGVDPTSPLYIAIPSYGAGVAAAIPAYRATPSGSFSKTTPGATLSWQANKDLLAYARVQTAFRAGGFNSFGPVDKLAYEPETSTNYEVGVKSDWLANRLRLNATAFDLRQEDILVFQLDSSFTGFLQNLGKAKTRGVELEASAILTSWLTVSAGVGWLDAKFVDGVQFAGFPFASSVAGKFIPYAPKRTASFVAQGRQPISNNLALTGYVSYRSRFGGFVDANNNFKLEGYDLVDLSFGVSGKGWTVAAVGSNILDNRYAAQSAGVPPNNLVAFNPGVGGECVPSWSSEYLPGSEAFGPVRTTGPFFRPLAMTDPLVAVQGQLEAYNRADADAFAAFYSPDAELFQIGGEPIVAGREAMRAHYAAFFRSNPKLHADVTGRLVSGRTVVDAERVSGLADGSVIHAFAVYDVEDGLIRRVWFRRDRVESGPL